MKSHETFARFVIYSSIIKIHSCSFSLYNAIFAFTPIYTSDLEQGSRLLSLVSWISFPSIQLCARLSRFLALYLSIIQINLKTF